jgi:cyclopropane-fatty-acyl-phospholipid synthase
MTRAQARPGVPGRPAPPDAGPDGGPVVVLRSPRALRRLLWHPGELGLAQAYGTGELDVDGDLEDGLRRAWDAAAGRTAVRPAAAALAAVRAAVRLRAVRGRAGP